MKVRSLVSVAAACAVAGLVSAQGIGFGGSGDQKLKVGSDAPALNIAEWVKGDKVEKFEADHTYIVEFWATWCGPCKRSIPHLTELQKELGHSLTIIGVSDEKAEVVKPFVTQMGKKMDYTVVVDNNNETTRAWRQAAGIDYIPFAFVVNGEGKIAWMGNPLEEEFGEVVFKVTDNRYNAELEEQAKPLLEQVDYCIRVEDWRAYNDYTNRVIAMDARVFNNVAINKFKTLLLKKKDVDGALAYARDEFVNTYMEDPKSIALLAKEILTNPDIAKSGADQNALKQLALELAETAVDQTGEGKFHALHILALAQYNNGLTAEAIETQKRAYFMAEEEYKDEYKRALETYQAGMRAGR